MQLSAERQDRSKMNMSTTCCQRCLSQDNTLTSRIMCHQSLHAVKYWSVYSLMLCRTSSSCMVCNEHGTPSVYWQFSLCCPASLVLTSAADAAKRIPPLGLGSFSVLGLATLQIAIGNDITAGNLIQQPCVGYSRMTQGCQLELLQNAPSIAHAQSTKSISQVSLPSMQYLDHWRHE